MPCKGMLVDVIFLIHDKQHRSPSYDWRVTKFFLLHSTIRNHSYNSFIIFLSIIITIHPISPIRLCSDFWWKGALFWPLRNLYVLVLHKKWKTSKNHIFFHPMQKCFWYVIFTGLIMIYDEWAPHRPIISTSEVNNRSNKVSSFDIFKILFFQSYVVYRKNSPPQGY